MLNLIISNLEISLCIIFLILEIIFFLIIKHQYIHEKIQGWLYITIFILLMLIQPILAIIGLVIIAILSINEFSNVLNFDTCKNYLFGLVFLLLIGGFCWFIYLDISAFFYFFIFVSLSDIVAYTIGKSIPWKKGFTKLSPNKSLSGVIAQIAFLAITSYLVLDFNILASIAAGILAPCGDLLESYFKRKAKIKDIANYIPGHGGILDRIDSSILSINLFLIWKLLFK